MEKTGTISYLELLLLLIGSAIMLPYSSLPLLTAPPANQDVWVIPIISILYKIVLALPLLFIINKFKGIGINDILEIIMGKIIGKIFAFIMVTFFVYAMMVFMLTGVIFINTAVFPETPKWALALYSIIPIIYASSKGAGTLARLSTFIVPYILVTIFVFFVMDIKDMDLFILKPILVDSSLSELNRGAFIHANKMTEVLVLLAFSANIKKDTKVNSLFGWFLIIFTIFIILIIIPTITTLGMDIAKHANNAYFTFTRQVKAYDFIQRLESFNVLGWFLEMLLKTSLYNYLASSILSGVVRTKTIKTTYKQFVVLIAIIVFILVMIPKISNSTTLKILSSNLMYFWVVMLVTIVIPIIMIIVYFVRKDKILELIKQHEKVQ
jgi:spore germination protein KB